MDLNRMFEEFWGVKLPLGVNVSIKNSRLLCRNDPEHTPRQLFQMTFGVNPPYGDDRIVQACDTWIDTVTRFLLEKGGSE
jgi:hypothetical protein